MAQNRIEWLRNIKPFRISIPYFASKAKATINLDTENGFMYMCVLGLAEKQYAWLLCRIGPV